MKGMERKQKQKQKRVKKEEPELSIKDITILAIEDCMRDGDYDGPETANELYYLLGNSD
jgi:hypothetical protein